MIPNFDYSEIEKQLKFSREYVSDVIDRIKDNGVIAEYYKQLYAETGRDRFFALSEEVANCSKLWQFDCHVKLKIMDLVRVQLCHNRFCSNCQKMIQATRMQKFVPVLLATSETKDLMHVVLTIPNMSGAYLKTYVTILFEACSRLVRFLRGTDRIKGVDLSPLGFSAAVRSCEVTFNTKAKTFHPHLHCIFAFDRGLEMPKCNTNTFSYDYDHGRRVFKRQFSDFEIFIQKLWRLLIDQITAKTYRYGFSLAAPLPKDSIEYGFFWEEKPNKSDKPIIKEKPAAVTLDAIHKLADGYSVIVDPIENDSFVQVFKYAFKLQSEDNQLIDCEQLKTLYGALLGRKTIQGYGDWYNMKVNDSIDESQNEFWDLFKAYLWQVDRPESVRYTPEEVLALMDCGDYTFITRRKLQHILEDNTAAELKRHKDEIAPLEKEKFSMPDLSSAYFKYFREKERSELFDTFNHATDPETGARVLILTAEQLDFLSSIF